MDVARLTVVLGIIAFATIVVLSFVSNPQTQTGVAGLAFTAVFIAVYLWLDEAGPIAPDGDSRE